MGKYTLPEMPYAYDALEPYIDAKTMEIHHTKHHQTYTDKLNAALETCPAEIQDKDILDILSDINSVPEDKRGAINFNGGGYDNHRLFWNNMKPNGFVLRKKSASSLLNFVPCIPKMIGISILISFKF